MTTAASAPNIALIKYWGNSNDDLRVPAAGSVSMTLDSPTVSISVEHTDELIVESDKKLTPTDLGRFEKTLENIKHYLILEGLETTLPGYVKISVDSKIPAGIGLASSAAVFSALAKAISLLVDTELTDEQIATMARLGSGSAARSIYDGFVALDADGTTRQVAPMDHWKLHDIIIAPDIDHKKVGSTEGHRLAHTSPAFDARIKAIEEYRVQECEDAITQKDFEKLMRVSEEDCEDMHCVMQTQNPPLQYLNDETHRLIRELKSLRADKHLPLLCTMDAGPTVHVICEEEAVEAVKNYAHAQEECTVFEAQVGKGSYSA